MHKTYFIFPSKNTNAEVCVISMHIAIVICEPQTLRLGSSYHKFGDKNSHHPHPKPYQHRCIRLGTEHTSLSNLEKNIKPDIALLGAFGSFFFFCFFFFPSSSSFDFFLEVDALGGRSFFISFLAGF